MIPVLRDARGHLCEFEILAQPLARADETGVQKPLAILVPPPRQRRERRVARGKAHLPRPRGIAARIRPVEPRRITQTGGGVFLFGKQFPKRGAAPCGDVVTRDAAGIVAGDPVLERQRLGHLAIDHGGAGRLACAGVAHHHRLVHL